MNNLAVLLPVGYAFGAGMVASVNPCGLFTVLNRPVFMAWLFPQTDVQAMEMVAAGVSMDFAPPASGFYEGDEVLFIHTESSDLEVAELLTGMMGPQVVFMLRLAES